MLTVRNVLRLRITPWQCDWNIFRQENKSLAASVEKFSSQETLSWHIVIAAVRCTISLHHLFINQSINEHGLMHDEGPMNWNILLLIVAFLKLRSTIIVSRANSWNYVQLYLFPEQILEIAFNYNYFQSKFLKLHLTIIDSRANSWNCIQL